VIFLKNWIYFPSFATIIFLCHFEKNSPFHENSPGKKKHRLALGSAILVGSTIQVIFILYRCVWRLPISFHKVCPVVCPKGSRGIWAEANFNTKSLTQTTLNIYMESTKHRQVWRGIKWVHFFKMEYTNLLELN